MTDTTPEDFQGLGCEPALFHKRLIYIIADCEFLMAQCRGLEEVHKQLDEAHAILFDVLLKRGWDE